MKLTEKTKAEILLSRLNLLNSGVPEAAMAHMNTQYVIGLLENQRPEWFVGSGEGTITLTPELKKVFDLLEQLIADETGNDAHLVTEDLYSAYKAYKGAR